MGLQARVGVATLTGAVALFSLWTTQASAAAPHTVAAGETLWSIAASNNLTTATVAAFNGVSEDYQVVLGETIQVPTVDEGAAALATTGTTTSTTAAPAEATAGSHAVVAGETLSGIAAANGISTEALASANGRSAGSLVYEGESLAIPAAGSATAAAPASSDTAWLGHVPSPYGELHLDPGAADSWNAMREESIATYGVDIYPAGSLSAYRTYEQQAQLYEDYLNGTGPLAAPPGTSSHETGTAIDLETESMRAVIDEIGGAYGWAKTEAPDEWWHVNYGW